MLSSVRSVVGVRPLLPLPGAGSGSRPLTPGPVLFPKYYMSARHMALAKAFPEHFTYEPHEADAVSGLRSL